jgi:hypothetical protein
VNPNEARVFDLIKHSKRKKHSKDILGVIQRQQLHRQQKLKEKQKRKLKTINLNNKTNQFESSTTKKFDSAYTMPKIKKY